MTEEILKTIYYNTADRGSYGGVEKLYRRAKEDVPTITRAEVQKFLTDQQSYSLHKPTKRKFVRNRTYVHGIDKQWQADLADMQSISRTNKGFRYLLTCIDVFSKFAWVEPVKSKTGLDVSKAFERILERANPRQPIRLQTDKGSEFYNPHFKKVMKKFGIELFSSFSDLKAAVVERFNRTLKTRIWTYFTANRTDRYTDVLDDIVLAYNNAYHRTIKCAPADVTLEREMDVWKNTYGTQSNDYIPSKKIKPGDKVRLNRWKGAFAKGYLPNWSYEHFLVDNVEPHKRAVYKLKDAAGEEIQGAYYKEEVQPIKNNKFYIEKVLKQRKTKKGSKEYFVKWKGWPAKFNTWITAKQKNDFSRHGVSNYITEQR